MVLHGGRAMVSCFIYVMLSVFSFVRTFLPSGVTGVDSVLKQSEQCPVYLVGNESEVLRLMLIVELVDIDG